jgi:tetratricopeptide (TPR) repeat protein
MLLAKAGLLSLLLFLAEVPRTSADRPHLAAARLLCAGTALLLPPRPALARKRRGRGRSKHREAEPGSQQKQEHGRRQAGDGSAAMEALRAGKVAQRGGDARGALAAYDRAAALAEAAAAGGGEGTQAVAARAHAAAGGLMLQLGAAGAERRLQLAVAADPTYGVAQLNLAHAHLQLGHHRRGLRVIRRFVARQPEDADGHRLLGHLLAATGDAAGAGAAWERALELRPADLESLQAWAHALFGAPTSSRLAAAVTARAAAALEHAALAATGTKGGGLQRLSPQALDLRRQHRRMSALACVAARRVASWVSHSCACIGSPCLRHCAHGASIGGRAGDGAAAARTAGGGGGGHDLAVPSVAGHGLRAGAAALRRRDHAHRTPCGERACRSCAARLD